VNRSPTEHSKEERKNGVKNTSRGKDTTISPKRDKGYWRERSNEDGSFKPHQKGPITATFTTDWFKQV